MRSLSLSPDGGIVENIGDPYEFEAPFWAGDRPVEPDPRWGESQPPYPLAFHPLERGEEALREFAGFVLEGRLHPDDVDADAVPLHGFRVTAPNRPDPARVRAELERRAAAMRLGQPHDHLPGGVGVPAERRRQRVRSGGPSQSAVAP